MLKATEKALRASIKHWVEDGPKGDSMDGDKCALCLRFGDLKGYNPDYVSCTRVTPSGKSEECPVYLRTGEASCHSTPWEPQPNPTQVKAEIKFLKSLLPRVTP